MDKQTNPTRADLDPLSELYQETDGTTGSENVSPPEASSGVLISWEELSRICDDPEILQVVAQTVLDETPEVLEKLQEAVGSQDVENIQLLSHRIKGTAKNLAARVLADKALALEMAAKNNQTENAQAMLDEIKAAVEQLKAFLSQENWIDQVKTAVKG